LYRSKSRGTVDKTSVSVAVPRLALWVFDVTRSDDEHPKKIKAKNKAERMIEGFMFTQIFLLKKAGIITDAGLR
jgi:hypothetical protein